jgi:PilZ domain
MCEEHDPKDPITPSTHRILVGGNLRREARVDACVKVQVVRGRRTIALETSDVSFKGLFLCTEEPPPLRSLMRLRVALPQHEIEAHAMVVHVATDTRDGRAAGVGVQFWGLAGPGRIAWDDFVRELIQSKRMLAKSK